MNDISETKQVLKKNNYKMNILFPFIIFILYIIRNFIVPSLPLYYGITIGPITTILLLGIVGIKTLSNIVSIVKTNLKLKKLKKEEETQSKLEYQKILKKKKNSRLSNMIYIVLLSICVWLRDFCPSVMVPANIATHIVPYATVGGIVISLASVIINIKRYIGAKLSLRKIEKQATELQVVSEEKVNKQMDDFQKELNNMPKNKQLEELKKMRELLKKNASIEPTIDENIEQKTYTK